MSASDKPDVEPDALDSENLAETAMLLEALAKKGPVVLMAKNPDKVLNRDGKPVKLNEDNGRRSKPGKSSTQTSTNSLRKGGRIRGVDGTGEKYIRERESN